MSIENFNIIDFISIDEQKNVVLTISDHLDWDPERQHLFMLQKKINAYLEAIEGGGLFDSYPDAKGKHLIISISAKYKPSNDGMKFLENVKRIVTSAGYGFNFKVIEHN